MSILNDKPRNLAVILIDLMSINNGVLEKWDGSKKVLNHMMEVLKKAEELGIPVFEFWKADNAGTYNIKKQRQDGGTILDLRKILHKKNRRNTVYTLRKPSGNVFEGDVFTKRTDAGYVHPDEGVPGTAESAGQSFEQILAALPNPIHIFVVMGYDANMCVAASMFGAFHGTTHVFVKGILDRGYNVITSRSVLASGNQPLKAEEGWPYMGPCRAV
jgi:nicotinamidase-related amidase